jgi:small-conductance mechanosensitive channel
LVLVRLQHYCSALVVAAVALDTLPSDAQTSTPSAPVPVRLGDDVVFVLHGPHDGKSAADRARTSAAALAQALQSPELPQVSVQHSDDREVVLAGGTPVVELGPEDSRLAGEASLEGYAHKTASAVRQALASEKKRSRIAETVFSWSLVVFFALIALYLIKKVTRITEKVRVWLEVNGDRALRISIKNIEIVRPAVLESTALILLSLARWVGQFGIFYAWLVIVLSLFEATRDYTERLTGFVIAPLSLLMGRAVTALPLMVVAGFAALAVFVLVRFIGLFFASVSRRETTLAWLPSDLAQPASVLLRIALVVAALVFAAPIVTGNSDGSLGRTGTVVLCALGLSAAPLFASGFLGAVVIFGRRLSIGEYVQVRGCSGRISAITLLEIRLQTPDGTEQRVPHLLLLSSALERFGKSPRVTAEILVISEAAPRDVLDLLTKAGDSTGRDSRAELVSLEGEGHRYRITATCRSFAERSALLQNIIDVLSQAGIQVGRGAIPVRLE